MEKFTIEFQPIGIRLVCEEAITILDAARQAGISLRADCGGEGICGKCRIQLLSGLDNIPPSENDRQHLKTQDLDEGFRLACTTIADRDLQVFIPPESIPSGQILQISGEGAALELDSLISQKTIQVQPAKLDDLRSDFTRLDAVMDENILNANLNVLRRIPGLLREHNWQINLVMRGKQIMHANPSAYPALLGLAVDVGSTKVACYLMDLQSGKMLAAKGTPNPQVMYGEDIMGRLGYAQKGHSETLKLHSIVMNTINRTAADMCREIQAEPEAIADACLVGNTAMHHFFLDLPSGSLAVSPFVPVTNNSLYPPAEQIGLQGMPGLGVYAPPVIAGFVGSDHLAFLLACGFGLDERVRLGIDIGTNTEIALQKGSRIFSVSTASGPAFEGAHIQYGMRAAPGAIEHVRIQSNGHIDLDIIGDVPASGICGSGILDAVGEMRSAGILNKRGRLDKSNPQVKLDKRGKPFISLTPHEAEKKQVTLSQNDIDQVLLAKGAIRAGIDVLMDHLQIKAEEINEVLIAGAFGSFMLPEQAIRIGMLPNIPLEHIRAVGNAAGYGARMMLVSNAARKQAEVLARQIEYLELTLYPDFDLIYANGILA